MKSVKKQNESAKIYEAYQSLFSLPSMRRLVLITVAEASFFSALFLLVTQENVVFNALMKTLLVILYFFLYPIIIRILVRNKETTLNLRRSIGLGSVSNGLGFLILLIGIVISRVFNVATRIFLLIGLGVIVVLTGIVLYTNAEISRGRTFLGVFIIYSCAYFIITFQLLPEIGFSIYMFVPPLILYLIASYLIVHIPLTIASKIIDVPGIDITRGFILAWTDKKFRKLEEVFDRLSSVRKAPIGLIRFRKIPNDDELILIVSTVHPGPFLNIGSSNMPYEVNRWFKEKYSCETIVLHGTCTHSENLPTRSELFRFIEMVDDLRLKTAVKDVKGAVLTSNDDDLSFVWQIFDNFIFSTVSKSPNEMDDLHFNIGLAFRELLKAHGYDGMLIDAHNSLREPSSVPLITLEDSESNTILNATKRLVQNDIRDITLCDIEAGWYNVKCGKISVKEGMGPGGIWALVERFGEKEFVYIIIDSNNLGLGLRDRILSELKKRGIISEGEVLTTDTHVVNAVSPKAGAYRLLDEEKLDLLLPCIIRAIEEARKRLAPVRIGVKIEEFPLKMLGEESVMKLMHGALAGSKAFELSLSVISILVIIILTLYSLII